MICLELLFEGIRELALMQPSILSCLFLSQPTDNKFYPFFRLENKIQRRKRVLRVNFIRTHGNSPVPELSLIAFTSARLIIPFGGSFSL